LGSFVEAGDSQVDFGWTAGLGVEAMLADNMSVKVEYARSEFAEQTYDFTDPAPFTIDSGYHTDVLKIGLNFHL